MNSHVYCSVMSVSCMTQARTKFTIHRVLYMSTVRIRGKYPRCTVKLLTLRIQRQLELSKCNMLKQNVVIYKSFIADSLISFNAVGVQRLFKYRCTTEMFEINIIISSLHNLSLAWCIYFKDKLIVSSYKNALKDTNR